MPSIVAKLSDVDVVNEVEDDDVAAAANPEALALPSMPTLLGSGGIGLDLGLVMGLELKVKKSGLGLDCWRGGSCFIGRVVFVDVVGLFVPPSHVFRSTLCHQELFTLFSVGFLFLFWFF